jgi:20S proteasome alpha/beta subunit
MAGFKDGKRFLATVDLHGMFLKNTYALTGFASYFCNPIITNNWNENMTE